MEEGGRWRGWEGEMEEEKRGSRRGLRCSKRNRVNLYTVYTYVYIPY